MRPWEIIEINEPIVSKSEGKGHEIILDRLLANRRIDSHVRQDYLQAEHTIPADPFLLNGMNAAVNIIHETIADSGKIAIFGDYDVDGITATAIMMETLELLGGIHTYYLPSRFIDGYGFSADVARRMADSGVRLIITVDCGIKDLEAVAVAKSLGVNVIITDHHQPGEELPPCDALIDPHCQEDAPFKGYAGAGVALKLSHALLGEERSELLDLAALGTVSDVVPLYGENRRIAKLGLEQLRLGARPGLVVLCEMARIDIRQLTSEQISFNLAPRLNSAGRMGHPRHALHCLLVDTYSKANRIAAILIKENEQRKKIEAEILREAITQIDSLHMEETGVVVAAGEKWHIGVLGIIASRLTERYSVPAVVLSITEKSCTGSARTVGKINIYEKIAACREHLQRFGGHAAAAGLTLDLEKLPLFQDALSHEMKKEPKENFVKPIKIDCVLLPEMVDDDLIRTIAQLHPTGEGNTAPVFLAPRVPIDDIRKFPRDLSHTAFWVNTHNGPIEGKFFNNVELAEHKNATCDFVFTPHFNEYGGIRRRELKLIDARIVNPESLSGILKLDVKELDGLRLGMTLNFSQLRSIMKEPEHPQFECWGSKIKDPEQMAIRIAWGDMIDKNCGLYIQIDKNAHLKSPGYSQELGCVNGGNEADFIAHMESNMYAGGISVLVVKDDSTAEKCAKKAVAKNSVIPKYLHPAMSKPEKVEFFSDIAYLRLPPIIAHQTVFETLLSGSFFMQHNVIIYQDKTAVV